MKLFVWDFHGVLEKDNEKAVLDISNQVLAQVGFKERFSEEDNEKFYGLKWYQYFEQLLPKLTKEECLELQAKCFKFSEDNLDVLAKHIKPNDYAVAVLTAITNSKNQQIVISNTRQIDLIWFLETVGLRQFFDEKHIIGVNAHQAHSTKADALKSYLKKHYFDKIVAIGDTENDLIVGKEVGAITYYYKHAHRQHSPTKYADHIIYDLRLVLSELR